ncbi:unnamed protein product [Ectocarpus sp. 6 AP-2014]
MAPVIDSRLCVTCSAPTNIAVIKYWGKDSVALNTPINSSASVTLSQQDDLRAITTVAASKDFEKDQLWLNGTEEDVSKNKRFQAVIRQVRALATEKRDEATGEVIVAEGDWDQYRVRIASRNTFPTAAGLASSAAGLACLTFSLAKLFNAKESFDGQLSSIARQGSGSACRSLYGGFVKWQKGVREDARDSIAVQVADEHHWPEMRALILVVSADKKDTSSTSGMSTSVQTSPLLGFRAKEVVEPRLAEIEKAYLEKDFATFGKITMQDSNQFHATCLDTYPPIFYMNDVSRSVIRIVHAYNAFHGEIRAAYTFDAGPNAVVYHLAGDSAELLALLLRFYPAPAGSSTSNGSTSTSGAYVNSAAALEAAREADACLPEGLFEACLKTGRTPTVGEVKMVYYTKAGGPPRVLGDEERMLDLETGNPVFPSASGSS